MRFQQRTHGLNPPEITILDAKIKSKLEELYMTKTFSASSLSITKTNEAVRLRLRGLGQVSQTLRVYEENQVATIQPNRARRFRHPRGLITPGLDRF